MRIAQDKHDDGVIDAVTTESYNGLGALVLSTQDDGADGSIDTTSTWTYDSKGRLSSIRHDHAAPGQADITVTFEYDAFSRLVRVINRGSSTFTIRYSYNSEGYLVEEVHVSGLDGPITSRESFEYDAAWRRSIHRVDWDGDGADDFIRTYRWSSAVLSYVDEETTGGFGKRRLHYEYDERGLRTKLLWDESIDGSIDITINYYYTDEGWLSLRTRDRGGIDLQEQWWYDALGRLVRRRQVSDITIVWTHENTCN